MKWNWFRQEKTVRLGFDMPDQFDPNQRVSVKKARTPALETLDSTDISQERLKQLIALLEQDPDIVLTEAKAARVLKNRGSK